MTERSPNVTWHAGDVSAADRARVLRGRGATIWLTGLSGSGKSTIAVALERALIEADRPAYRLDGDNVRHGLNADLGFSESDRAENVRRVGEVALLMADAGLVAICCFISPYRRDRDRVRERHRAAQVSFLEVHVHAPLEVAEARDPKGLYRKARAGEIRGFTGIDDPYEAPEHPELRLDTAETPVPASVDALVALLRTHHALR